MGEKRVKIDVTPEVTRQIATRRAVGVSLRDLEAEFGFSRPVINRILNSDLAKEVQKGVIEDAVKGAIAAIRVRLSNMTDLALQALEDNLKEGQIEAVKLYFKALGIDTAEKEKGSQSQAITVVLPGQATPKDIEVGSG